MKSHKWGEKSSHFCDTMYKAVNKRVDLITLCFLRDNKVKFLKRILIEFLSNIFQKLGIT